MAQEEAPTQKVKIFHKSKIYQDMSAFCLSEIFSDVTIVVEGQNIPAHKIVLAARCEFFNSLLINNPDQIELRLTDVPLEALKEILKYIYTGSVVISLDKCLLFDILKLAQDFSLNTFETAINDTIKSFLNLENVCFFLNRANQNNFIELRDNCHSFIDKHVAEVLDCDCLNYLNQTSMTNLLERDSLPFYEIDVFRKAADWCKNNIDVGNSVMNCVRLHSLSKEEILKEVWPSKLVDANKLLAAIAAIEDGTLETLQRRRQITETESSNETSVECANGQSVVISQDGIRKVKDQNIATPEFKAQVIAGENTDHLLMGNKNEEIYAYHNDNDKNGIIVDLGEMSSFNHVCMKLPRHWWYRYYIEVSVNQLEWVKIIDYSNYWCRSYQNLYFPVQNARYVRVVGTNWPIRIIKFEVLWKTNCPEIYEQYVCPIQDVATREMGASIKGARLFSRKSEHMVELQLAQPYYISRIKIRYPVENGTYKIETLCSGTDSLIVANNSSWQIIDFSSRLVDYIQITSSSQNLIENFTFDDIQCFYYKNENKMSYSV